MTGAAIVVALAILFTYLTGRMAERRGRSVTAWVLLGAFFGPFALIAVALLPSQHQQAAP